MSRATGEAIGAVKGVEVEENRERNEVLTWASAESWTSEDEINGSVRGIETVEKEEPSTSSRLYDTRSGMIEMETSWSEVNGAIG